jgi:hypothetical protein
MVAAADIWKNSSSKIAHDNSAITGVDGQEQAIESSVFSVEVSREVIEPFLNDRDIASVDAFDLYDAMLNDLKTKLGSSQSISAIYKERSEALVGLLAKSEAELKQAKLTKDALIQEFSNAPVGVVVDSSQVDALKLICEEKTALVANLEEEKALLVATVQEALERCNESEKALTLLEGMTTNSGQLNRNLMAAAEGRLIDAKKTSAAEQLKLSNTIAKRDREIEVIGKDLAKFKATVSENKKGSISVLETLQNAKRIRDELTDALAEARNDRRYLTMLVDSITHQQIFTCPEGSATLFSFQTHNVSAVDDKCAIDESFPLALWLGTNGFACVLGVSVERENGERELVMPDSALLSRKAVVLLSPPKKYHAELADKLMEFDVQACNEAMTRNRLTISQLAINAEFEENAKLANKDLIAYSRARRQAVAAHFSTKGKRKKGGSRA